MGTGAVYTLKQAALPITRGMPMDAQSATATACHRLYEAV